MPLLIRSACRPPGVLVALVVAACATPAVSWTNDRLASPSTEESVLVGTVLRVADGDSITVQLDSGPVFVRLHSVDAPERSQPWGREAHAALAGRLNGQVVSLEVRAQDRYDRLVAIVLLGDENINGWMVRQGHGWAYRRYLDDPVYCDWESSARSARLGLWGLQSTGRYAPWEWRRMQRGEAVRFTDYSEESAAHCKSAMRRPAARSATGAAPAAPAPVAPVSRNPSPRSE